MEDSLAGKLVLITGSSKGIGFACAKEFLAHGCRVVLTGRSAEALADASNRLGAGATIETAACDLAVAADRTALAARFPDVDILVNNAGSIPGGDLFTLDLEQWQASWQLKMFGYIHLTQLYLRLMKDRTTGVIVNIIGDSGRAPSWNYICGSTANAGLIAFTEAVGAKSVDWNVRVFGINPTQTATDRLIRVAKSRAQSQFGDEARWTEFVSGTPFNRLCEADEVARLVTALSSPQISYLSGTVIDYDGGRIHRR